jgi:hypothetical protein
MLISLLAEHKSDSLTEMKPLLMKVSLAYFGTQVIGAEVDESANEIFLVKQKNAALTASSILDYFFQVTSW